MDQATNLSPIAVFIASLLGSAHCAGMCGPFTLLLSKDKLSEALYHLGRFTSYSAIGALAGLLGKSVIHTLPFTGAVWASALLMGLSFIISGVLLFFKQRLHLPNLPGLDFAFNKIHSLSGSTKSFAIGLISVLLPCGWLYGFVLGAIATGSPIKGAIFLGAFWLGTIPALSISKYVIQLAPRMLALLLILFGLSMIVLRVAPGQSHNHSHHSMPQH